MKQSISMFIALLFISFYSSGQSNKSIVGKWQDEKHPKKQVERQYSYQEIEAKAYQKLEMLGMKEQALKPASKLSGGQQQRISIVRALINDPIIIIGDEPTGNLDSKNTQIVFEIFKELSQDFGQTIIAVTHDNDFAKASDRTIELADGKIINHHKVFE